MKEKYLIFNTFLCPQHCRVDFKKERSPYRKPRTFLPCCIAVARER